MTTNVVYFRTDGDRALFFRGVDAAEYADWKAHGVLRGIPGGMAFGKHLATTPAHAIAWRHILPTAGDRDPPHVLRVSFPLAVAYRLFASGPGSMELDRHISLSSKNSRRQQSTRSSHDA